MTLSWYRIDLDRHQSTHLSTEPRDLPTAKYFKRVSLNPNSKDGFRKTNQFDIVLCITDQSTWCTGWCQVIIWTMTQFIHMIWITFADERSIDWRVNSFINKRAYICGLILQFVMQYVTLHCPRLTLVTNKHLPCLPGNRVNTTAGECIMIS